MHSTDCNSLWNLSNYHGQDKDVKKYLQTMFKHIDVHMIVFVEGYWIIPAYLFCMNTSVGGTAARTFPRMQRFCSHATPALPCIRPGDHGAARCWWHLLSQTKKTNRELDHRAATPAHCPGWWRRKLPAGNLWGYVATTHFVLCFFLLLRPHTSNHI